MEIRYRSNPWARAPRMARTQLRRRSRARTGAVAFLREYSADALTFSRIVLAGVLMAAALVDGQANLPGDLWLLVLAWTTDILDGQLARRFQTEKRSWLGHADVYIDMFVAVSVLVYMTATGLIPLAAAVAYLLGWSLVFLRFGFPAVLAQVFQNPIYLVFLFLIAVHAPQVLPWLALFAAAGVALFWRRLAQLLAGVWLAIRRPGQQNSES